MADEVDSPSPSVSVVIPTHDRAAILDATLAHLAGQRTTASWELIVVNNRCSDDTAVVVRRASEHASVPLSMVDVDKPGPAAARNAGAAAARGDVLVFLDDDIVVESDCIERVLAAQAKRAGTWVVGQVLALPEHTATPFGKFRNAMLPPTPRTAEPVEVQWFASGLASIPTEEFRRVGGYNERFATPGLEDADLVIRAKEVGSRVFFEPGLVGHHNDWAGSSIGDYCRRQRIHCITAVLLEERFPGKRHQWTELLRLNSPPRAGDPLPVVVRKVAKFFLGMAIPRRVLLVICAQFEQYWPNPRVLWPLYRTLISGATYAGVAEGRRQAKRTAARVTGETP
jgi:glycosyltransferase involved in cell wall biosynthesis